MSHNKLFTSTLLRLKEINSYRKWVDFRSVARFCSSGSGKDGQDGPGQGQGNNTNSESVSASANVTDSEKPFIPSRIRKRLEQKGISLEDVEVFRGTPVQAVESRVTDPSILETNVEDKPYVEHVFPSDIDTAELERERKQKRAQEQHAYRPTEVAPEKTSILLFPGQGSQFVGMGKELLKYPDVEDIYERASTILGYDLLKLCINGPKEKLDQTLYCQPAVVVTSLAAMEKFKEEWPIVRMSFLALIEVCVLN